MKHQSAIFGSVVIALVLTLGRPALGQVEIRDETYSPRTNEPGRPKADKYFAERKSESRESDEWHYLMLHAGGFFDQQAYSWGADNYSPAKFNAGVTYRIGEWTHSMDLFFRADVTTFSLNEGRAVRLSLLPMVAFPEASSRFPLYFGGGIGPGIFFKQIRGSSSLSLDYQIVAGVRFFNVYETMGLMAETGLKNSLFLFSEGQSNTVFFNVGAIFTF